MKHEEPTIQHVSDTALWVAYYRSLEGDRAKPLFHDPYAKLLIGDRGQQIAESAKATSAHTEYNVLIRTVIIDRYIQSLVNGEVDCVLNLGAGMDTRPYRLNLPSQLKWIEVDYPNIITLKEEKLASEKPKCQLQRVALDLNDRAKRKSFFDEVSAQSKKILVLTEGVLPYLTDEQVGTLAEDLWAETNFEYWIADYISPTVIKYLRKGKHAKTLKNAPLQFYPQDWFGFFRSRGWNPEITQYLPEEGLKLGRKSPVPLIAKLLSPFFSKELKTQFMRSYGYMLLKRKTIS